MRTYLTDEQATDLRNLHADGTYLSSREAGEAFGVSKSNAKSVIRGQSFAHLPMPLVRDRRVVRFERGYIPEPNTGCWLWIKSVKANGYGLYQKTVAHRWSYEHFVGPIPDGLFLDHLCRTRCCVNPRHLEPVTARENTRRSPIAPATINRLKTHCKRGHEFTEENTINRPTGYRGCHTCNRARAREHYYSNRGKNK